MNLKKYIYLVLWCFLPSLLLAQSADLKKANKEFELQNYSAAIKSYLEILKTEPNNVAAMSKLGDAYSILNNLENAKKFYDKSVRIPGVRPETMLNYAHTLMMLGDYANANTWFSLYAEGVPDVGNHFAVASETALKRKNTSPIFKVKSSNLSTSSSDFGAAFFGNMVVFASTREDIKLTNPTGNVALNGRNQLFIGEMNSGGTVDRPRHLKKVLKNNLSEGPVSFTKDGRMVAYTKNNFKEGVRQVPAAGLEMSIYIAEVKENGEWVNEVAFAHNGSGFSTGFPSFSPDGKQLYFSSNRPDGYGGYDIFVSQRTGSTWSQPSNLGSFVNSAGNEITPFHDGKQLYFSSDWHPGFGGFDIFRAEQSGSKWTKVFHQGTAVNSSRDDYGFAYNKSKNIGFFTSNRKGGKGNEDLYIASKAVERFLIVVKDADSKQLLQDVILDFSACGGKVVTTDKEGRYGVQAQEGFTCDVIARMEGYKSQTLKIKGQGNSDVNKFDVNLVSLNSTTKPPTVDPTPPVTETTSPSGGTTTPPTTEPSEGTIPPVSNVATTKYFGKVIKAGSAEGIAGVKIWVTNPAQGNKYFVETDLIGNYVLELPNNTGVNLLYSKAGFVEFERIVNTKDGSDKSILDVSSMRPVLTDPIAETTPPSGGGGTTTSPSTGTTPPTTNPTPPSGGASTPPPSTDSGVSTSTGNNKGYAIQVAAIGLSQNVDENNYSSLNKYGKVYVREIGKYKKVRVGLYASKAIANKALKSIAASTRYSKAYIINEDAAPDEAKMNYDTVTTPTEPPPSTGTTKVIPPSPTPPAPTVSTGTYMVQLGAYKNPKWFDGSKMEVYGPIVDRRKGDLTLKLVSNISSKNRAMNVQQKALEAGFPGAYVVEEKNGVLVRVR